MVNVTQRSTSPRANALWMAFTGFALAAAAGRGVRADGHASCDSGVMRSHARLIAGGGAALS